MPFYNIPNNSREFNNAFASESVKERRRVIDLTVYVNKLIEKGKLDDIEMKGSFLYYKNLVFVHTDKRNRGHAYYFYPTDTMKKPLRDRKRITRKLLDNLLLYSYSRGTNSIFWEFFSKPGEIWVSGLSQAYA